MRGYENEHTRACAAPRGASPGLHPGHPTAVEGCRPASRGLSLTLVTFDNGRSRDDILGGPSLNLDSSAGGKPHSRSIGAHRLTSHRPFRDSSGIPWDREHTAADHRPQSRDGTVRTGADPD